MVTSCAPTSTVGSCSPTAPDMGSTCTNDSQCAAPSARCLSTRSGSCECSSDACSTDSDCQGGSLCACSTSGYSGLEGRQNHCVPTNCHTDGDCDPGQYCAPSLDEICGTFLGVTRWACTTPKDTCRLDSDCATFGVGVGATFGVGVDFSYAPPHCIYSPALGYFACSTAQCAG